MVTTMSESRAQVEVEGDCGIRITRRFSAGPPRVFHAYTTPELVSRWWPGRRGQMKICEIDLRVGGSWRYVMEANGGFEVAFHGVYQEVEPERRLVSTEVFELMPDAEAITETTFAADGDGTLLTILVTHSRPEHRDAHINSGMEGGLNEAMDVLEALVSGAA